jgi:N-acetyl-anhydromuramyl-L-alanine amidase AmpD
MPAFALPIPLLATLYAGTSIVVAGQKVDVGRPVVLWNEPEGFDSYAQTCVETKYMSQSPCCARTFKRYGERKGMKGRDLAALKAQVFQLVLHLDGCVNSRSCFYSMHDTPRPDGGCGLSAHFMIDADGTIYQTLDLLESAWHAEQSNSYSVGVEICNRGDAGRNELDRLPAEYRSRPVKDVTINGHVFHAFDFRPEQYESVIALARVIVRIFPQVRPVIPERDGKPLLETLPDPLAFHGIVGHLHVDKQRHKWDPGAFNWERLLRSLHGFHLPVTVGTFASLPEDRSGLTSAARALFRNAEERTHGFFPIGAGRLWHSGVHLRTHPGEPVFAPVRGRLVAARLAQDKNAGKAAASFVLIRHDLVTNDGPVTFYSLMHHLATAPVDALSPLPWVRELAAAGPSPALDALSAGQIALLDRPLEAGDIVGRTATVARGAESGEEVHFEIFSAAKLPGTLGKSFRYLEAAADGPFVRRGALVGPIDSDRDGEITPEELRDFFRNPDDLLPREALRHLAIRHVHEWGDILGESSFVETRELAHLSAEDRRTLYRTVAAPYVFLTRAVADHAGLPPSEAVYSYHPITFLVTLAARAGNIEMRWPPRAPIADTDLEPRPADRRIIDAWTREPPPEQSVTAFFGQAVDTATITRRRGDIPLIVLPPTSD